MNLMYLLAVFPQNFFNNRDAAARSAINMLLVLKLNISVGKSFAGLWENPKLISL